MLFAVIQAFGGMRRSPMLSVQFLLLLLLLLLQLLSLMLSARFDAAA